VKCARTLTRLSPAASASDISVLAYVVVRAGGVIVVMMVAGVLSAVVLHTRGSRADDAYLSLFISDFTALPHKPIALELCMTSGIAFKF